MKESGNEVRRELKRDVVSADGSIEISSASELVTEFNVGERSLLARLGCQIVITEELDGLTVRLPAATRNLLRG